MKKLLLLAVVLVLGAFGSEAQAANSPPTLNLCTGKTTGNYYKAGLQISAQAKGAVAVNVVDTAGSMENLNKLSAGECDAAIVQSDAYLVYKKQNPKSDLDLERAAALYQEYVHFLCNRASGITRVTQLTSKTPVAVGPLGSGSAVTWDGFVLADPKTYKDIPTVPIDGVRAVKKVAEGSDVTCMIYVAGLKTPFMMEDATAAADRVILAKADDGDMDKILDPKKKPVYEYTAIPSGTYKGLQDGFFGSSVKTLATTAILVVNTKWIDANDKGYEAFLKAETHAEPAIKQLVAPPQ